MATSKEAQSVKSLNTTPGRRNRRFVFKTFAARIDETEVDVFRSLDPLKAKPSGSTFFIDSLVHWRELNTGKDFVSFYDELIKNYQDLPQILLKKEDILNEMLSRLQINARLSLEPILRSTAELSRDLLEEFIPFLPRIVDSLLDLLKNGADKEPELVEQIFTSWSYVMMYLQKYLTQDVIYVLKITLKLRYYPKDFIQEFMAEATSFLLRNAPVDQLRKGIGRILFEVARKPTKHRIHGASSVLWQTMRGTASKFHSRAKTVLEMLISASAFNIQGGKNQESYAVVDVTSTTFQRLCMELNREELNLMWDCLYREVDKCIIDGNTRHLGRLLSILTSTISFEKGKKVCDAERLLRLSGILVETYIKPSHDDLGDEHLSEVVSGILELMLCILDGSDSLCGLKTLSDTAVDWGSAFQLKNPRILTFLKELLQKDPCILSAFQNSILSSCRNWMRTWKTEVIYLLLSFCEKLQFKARRNTPLDGQSEDAALEIFHFLHAEIRHFKEKICLLKNGEILCGELQEADMCLLWGTVCCYPFFFKDQEDASLLIDLVDELHQLCSVKDMELDKLLVVPSGDPKQLLQSLIGVALNSFHMLSVHEKKEPRHITRVLNLAKEHKSSPHILSSVADFLDAINRSSAESTTVDVEKHPVPELKDFTSALAVYVDNMTNPEKKIRVSTLRILRHYESCPVDTSCNVLQLLSLIEDTPISVQNSRKLTLLVSKIQTELISGRVSKVYECVALTGIIGILFNQFRDLSSSALDCLAVLLERCSPLVWDKFVIILENFLLELKKVPSSDGEIVTSGLEVFDLVLNEKNTFPVQGSKLDFDEDHGSFDPDLDDRSETLVLEASDEVDRSTVRSSESQEMFELFYSYAQANLCGRPCISVVPLLLQALQKIPTFVEARSRNIIPIFFKFLGYNDGDPQSVWSFRSFKYEAKDWKPILMEWLNLLKVMKNPKSFFRSKHLKEILEYRFLDDNDAEVQMKVIDCLLNWKDGFLLPYSMHLKNLICSKTLREELTTWSLSNETNLIEDGHRKDLVPLIIRLLMPKIRNLKTLASRKHASMSGRRAIIGFINQLDPSELPLFFAMLIKPFRVENSADDAVADCLWGTLEITANNFQVVDFLKFFSLQNILNLPWKKRSGFLHVVEDIVAVFVLDGTRSKYLELLSECVVRVLHSCYFGLFCRTEKDHAWLGSDAIAITGDAANLGSPKQLKELRSLCLKIISILLHRYHDFNFSSEFWTLFFASVKHLIDGLKDHGSTSERPNSLFSCILAMSQSHNLVSLLCRESNLVKDIFSLLSVKSAPEAVHMYVLKFAENLLYLAAAPESKDRVYNKETANEHNAARSVLHPNLKVLIDNLCCFFHHNHGQKRKLVRRPGETVMRVLKLLSEYIIDPMMAKGFVDILLPIIQNGAHSSDVCMATLPILVKVVPVLSGEKVTTIINNVVAPLLVTAELDLRSSVCELLAALAHTDRSLLSLAELVRELNASDMEIDDFDEEIKGYGKITSNYFDGIRKDHAIVILSNCIHDMSSEELMLRNSAYRALSDFVGFCARVFEQEVAGQSSSEQKMAVDGCNWTMASIEGVVNKFLLKHMGCAMSKGPAAQKVWLDLLREMISKLSGLRSLKNMEVLRSNDAEEDFFNNITHIQIRYRAKALIRFADIVSKGELSRDMTRRVFVPLFFSILFDLEDGKWEHVRCACLDALAAASGQMGWKSYSELLMKCFRDIAKRPGKRKVLVRLICSVLNKFHFSKTIVSNGEDLNDNDSKTETFIPSESDETPIAAEISFLLELVLPKLQKLLSSDSDNINIDISLAALKVLKLLPTKKLESNLPSIIHRIANFLKNRLESTRDEARSALAACLKELGIEYLQFVVRALRATLRRGYELHVLGYTLNFLLSKVVTKRVGELDHCLDDLLSIIQNDILGDVALEKEVEKIASKMKETKKHASFETLELVAQNVSFKAHAKRLLSSVTAYMQTYLTPKVKSKLENMLDRLAAGIERNPSANSEDLFTFTYCLVQDGIAGEHHAHESSSVNIVKDPIVGGQSRKMLRTYSAADKLQGWHLVTVFALRLLHNRMRCSKLVKDDQLISFLDPFVKLLTICLNSKYEGIITASLRCMFHLIKLPLPSMESQAENIKAAVLESAQSSFSATSPLMETCLRLLTELLQSTKVTLSREQLNVLVDLPVFLDLEKNPSFVVLSLLKAIIRRKLVVPKIYDLASTVAELMITSQSGPIRNRCSQILLQFLMKYELSQKRLEKHLNDLIANVERYEHANGREAVLEMISAIIRKSSREFIEERSWGLFLILMDRLVHDPDNHVRSLVGAAIQLLVSRIGSASLDTILKSSFSWYLGENQQLWSAAAQVLGLLVEVLKEGFRKHISRVLLLPSKEGKIRIKGILQSAVETARQPNVAELTVIPRWKETYYSLVLFQKIVWVFPEFFFKRDVEYIWEAAIELLIHPHLWIRSISSRLVALCFEQTSKEICEQKMHLGSTYHTRMDRLFIVAVSHCCQLKGKLSDDVAVEFAKNNIVFVLWGIHTLKGSKDPRAFWSGLNSEEQKHFVEATQLLDSSKKSAILESLIVSGDDDEQNDDRENREDLCQLLVSSLLETVGKFALQAEDAQTKAFLSSLDLFASKIGLKSCEGYTSELVHPLYRLCEGFTGKIVSEDVKHYAEEVMGRMRGIDNFVEAYRQIAKQHKFKRDAKKQKEKVMAVVNPQLRAKRKLRAAAKHKANKKRKIMTMKMGRWMR